MRWPASCPPQVTWYFILSPNLSDESVSIDSVIPHPRCDTTRRVCLVLWCSPTVNASLSERRVHKKTYCFNFFSYIGCVRAPGCAGGGGPGGRRVVCECAERCRVERLPAVFFLRSGVLAPFFWFFCVPIGLVRSCGTQSVRSYSTHTVSHSLTWWTRATLSRIFFTQMLHMENASPADITAFETKAAGRTGSVRNGVRCYGVRNPGVSNASTAPRRNGHLCSAGTSPRCSCNRNDLDLAQQVLVRWCQARCPPPHGRLRRRRR